jgi:hypothetical protein
MSLLPQKLTIRFAERHQYTAVARLFGIAWCLVVGADQDDAVRHNHVAVAL